MPVIAVEDIGREVQIGNCIHHGTCEESILLPFRITAAINRIAEIEFTVYQINRYSIQNQFFNPCILVTPAEIHIKSEHVLNFSGILLLNAAVIGSDHTRINAERSKILRQGTDYIRQAARFGKRSTLGGNEQDIRQFFAFLCGKQRLKFFLHSIDTSEKYIKRKLLTFHNSNQDIITRKPVNHKKKSHSQECDFYVSII